MTLGKFLGDIAKAAATRAAEGAVGGVKREFSPDVAGAALKTLEQCLLAADVKTQLVIVEALRELADNYDPASDEG